MAWIIDDMVAAAIHAMMRGLDPNPVKVTDKKQLDDPDVGMVVWHTNGLHAYKKRKGGQGARGTAEQKANAEAGWNNHGNMW